MGKASIHSKIKTLKEWHEEIKRLNRKKKSYKFLKK